MLYKLNEQSVAKLQILFCLHGEFENNYENHVGMKTQQQRFELKTL
jgi:hypothetical protein